jgi:hypothetical protein
MLRAAYVCAIMEESSAAVGARGEAAIAEPGEDMEIVRVRHSASTTHTRADPPCKPRGAAAPTQFSLSLQYVMLNSDLLPLRKQYFSHSCHVSGMVGKRDGFGVRESVAVKTREHKGYTSLDRSRLIRDAIPFDSVRRIWNEESISLITMLAGLWIAGRRSQSGRTRSRFGRREETATVGD